MPQNMIIVGISVNTHHVLVPTVVLLEGRSRIPRCFAMLGESQRYVIDSVTLWNVPLLP